ncbi:hypothetical protein AB8U03_15600 [Clostridium sp. Mt-5]|uniref:Uncharacterized protein n=1 Tax=Clostridium moutaii TaxID=3240932 RepID=A0ABV4BS38_9CLOT
MTITSYNNGNLIYYRNKQWLYEDGTSIDKENRPCPKCGKMPTKKGYDACLGYIPGVINACCGHGVAKGYIMYKDGGIKELPKL